MLSEISIKAVEPSLAKYSSELILESLSSRRDEVGEADEGSS